MPVFQARGAWVRIPPGVHPKWAVGSGQWAVGSGQWAVGSRTAILAPIAYRLSPIAYRLSLITYHLTRTGGVVANTPDSRSGEHGFESRPVYQLDVPKWPRERFAKPSIAGSSPAVESSGPRGSGAPRACSTPVGEPARMQVAETEWLVVSG